MFTGIVEELGEVIALHHGSDAAVLTIRGPLVSSDAALGSSVAVNGVCLTVTRIDGEQLSMDVMAETLRRSSLGGLRPGMGVNLERPMAANGRFGGHIVQGHVDGTGTVLSRTPGSAWDVVTISAPAEVTKYLVNKGSVTVDGVSLTCFDIDSDRFTVSLIPTTLEATNLGQAAVGTVVNLEADILGKYIVKHLQGEQHD